VAKLGPSDVGVTASQIKVGHIGIYSGPVGSFGQNLSYACRGTLQAINDSGGINGRKLDVLVRDDGWDATKGSNAVRDLVERDKVFAFACSQSVPTNDAITPYLDAQKVPNVGSDGWGPAQYAGVWSFPVGASGVNEAENLADYQAKHGTKRVGILYWNNTTGGPGRPGGGLPVRQLRRPGDHDLHRPVPGAERRHDHDPDRPRHLRPHGA
jgi:branched-chain amino acid transport system substrate-binding protein